MSQQDIILFLSEYPNKKFTVIEIANKINLARKTVEVSARKLRHFNEVNFKLIPRNINSFVNYYIYWYRKEV